MLCLISSLLASVESDWSRPTIELAAYIRTQEHSAFTELLGNSKSGMYSIACPMTGYSMRSSYRIGRGS